MSRPVKMLGRVFVLRLIAAADMPTNHAEAKMNPGVARFQAFLTSIGGAWFYIFDLIEVCAGCSHKIEYSISKTTK
jgi:hypothetical protein